MFATGNDEWRAAEGVAGDILRVVGRLPQQQNCQLLQSSARMPISASELEARG